MGYLLLEDGGKLLLGDGTDGGALLLGEPAAIPPPAPQSGMEASTFAKGGALIAQKFGVSIPASPYTAAPFIDDASALLWLPTVRIEAEPDVIHDARAVLTLDACRLTGDPSATRQGEAVLSVVAPSLRGDPLPSAPRDDAELALLISLIQ